MSELAIKNVSVRYSGKNALCAVDFKVEEGSFVVVLGPSGAGKTTLLRAIAGLCHIDTGEITLGEKRIDTLSPKDRNVSMVFQNYALYPHMNVYDNISFSLKLKKTKSAIIMQRVQDISRALRIGDLLERMPNELSGGEKQRVALARAIIKEPSIYLMDEPLANLDPLLRESTLDELRSLHDKIGKTFIYVTHDQKEAMRLGDTLVVLNEGNVVQIGEPLKLYNDPSCLFIETFLGDVRTNVLEGFLSFTTTGIVVYTKDIQIFIKKYDEPNITEESLRKEVYFAIRPQAISITENGMFCGIIEDICDIGDRCYVTLNINSLSIKCDLSCRLDKSMISSVVNFDIDREKVHVFDKITKKRIVIAT